MRDVTSDRAVGSLKAVGAGASNQRRRAHIAMLIGLCASLVATACGARVPPAGVDEGLGNSQLGTTSGGAGHSGTAAVGTTRSGASPTGSSGGAPVGSTKAGAATPGKNTTATDGTKTKTGSKHGGTKQGGSASTPSSFSFEPAAEAAQCASRSGNTASDKGVTPTSITLGNVSGLTGPLPGTDNQGPEAVQALFSAVNAAGGICGRQLKLLVEDDQQDASTDAADVANLIAKPVFAFVGSTSDADNGGVPEMVQANAPDVGFAINCNRSLAAIYFSPAGGSCEERNGHEYFTNSSFAVAKSAGYLPSHMAILAYNIGISADSAKAYAAAYQQLGGSICYSDYAISAASASLTPDVEQIKQHHCNGVFTVIDTTGNAKLLKALQQQSVHLPYVGTTFDAYTPVQIAEAGESAAQGLTMTLNFIPLNESQPAVQLYQHQLGTYEPGKQPSAFGFMAWEAGQMLIYALVANGHSPTRAGVERTFRSLHHWTGGGALGPYDVPSHGFGPCSVDVQVKGNQFLRRAPSTGMFCKTAVVRVN
jgi:ABC-type branched-subunit amino acid transport system substrate-binding protein